MPAARGILLRWLESFPNPLKSSGILQDFSKTSKISRKSRKSRTFATRSRRPASKSPNPSGIRRIHTPPKNRFLGHGKPKKTFSLGCMIPKPLISDVFDFCSVFKFPRPNDNFECRGPPETTWTGTRNAPKQHNLQNHPKPVQKRSKNGPLPSGCGIAKRQTILAPQVLDTSFTAATTTGSSAPQRLRPPDLNLSSFS